MTRRKSIKKIVQDFQSDTDDVKLFAAAARVALSAPVVTWSYEYAIIRLYRDFEDLS